MNEPLPTGLSASLFELPLAVIAHAASEAKALHDEVEALTRFRTVLDMSPVALCRDRGRGAARSRPYDRANGRHRYHATPATRA